MWLFLAIPWLCLQFVIVVFLDHTHLLFLSLKQWHYFHISIPQSLFKRCVILCTNYRKEAKTAVPSIKPFFKTTNCKKTLLQAPVHDQGRRKSAATCLKICRIYACIQHQLSLAIGRTEPRIFGFANICANLVTDP